MPWWVLIVLAALALGAFTEWLEFRRKQAKIAAETRDTTRDLDVLRDEFEQRQARLVRRIEHLEAIVTDKSWDEIRSAPEAPDRLDAMDDAFGTTDPERAPARRRTR